MLRPDVTVPRHAASRLIPSLRVIATQCFPSLARARALFLRVPSSLSSPFRAVNACLSHSSSVVPVLIRSAPLVPSSLSLSLTASRFPVVREPPSPPPPSPPFTLSPSFGLRSSGGPAVCSAREQPPSSGPWLLLVSRWLLISVREALLFAAGACMLGAAHFTYLVLLAVCCFLPFLRTSDICVMDIVGYCYVEFRLELVYGIDTGLGRAQFYLYCGMYNMLSCGTEGGEQNVTGHLSLARRGGLFRGFCSPLG
jgi:hypothetical protein